MDRRRLSFAALVWALVVVACTRSVQGSQPWRAAPKSGTAQPAAATPTPPAFQKRAPGGPMLSPTPDAPRVLPTPRLETDQYVVQPNDTLGQIAQRFGVSLEKLIETNSLANPDRLEVGQVIEIPPPDPLPPGPGFKIIPDSELVYGPSSADFDLPGYVSEQNGYLNHYDEDLNGTTYDGAGVVARVAAEYSVNPRLLLAVLEQRSGWVTNRNPSSQSRDYPMLYFDVRRQGLYRQLAWAANNLNRGFYLWRIEGQAAWVLQDDSVVPINPTINAGTAGVQHFYSMLLGHDEWQLAVSEEGLFAVYSEMFGYPFDYAYEPLQPPNLQQPVMQLPFEPGEAWSFTGGPHAGWADGSAWAALDFAPPGPALGCVQNDAWVTAVADGKIVYVDTGLVLQDLDGDGRIQTGWTVVYMHVESRDRVMPGTYLKAGDRIGHASCEGGVSTGTHLHLARRYNGEWISADTSLPFVLDGWTSKGDGIEYNGYLVKDGVTVEAWEGRRTENQISR